MLSPLVLACSALVLVQESRPPLRERKEGALASVKVLAQDCHVTFRHSQGAGGPEPDIDVGHVLIIICLDAG